MLTGLQLSSLACKCLFHGPEHNAKGKPHVTLEGLEMKK